MILDGCQRSASRPLPVRQAIPKPHPMPAWCASAFVAARGPQGMDVSPFTCAQTPASP